MKASEFVYVIGDKAATPFAGLAQTALHDAQFVAAHINGSTKKYSAVMPISIVPVGHNWATFEWGKLHFVGVFGSMMRKFADLIGYHDVLPLGMALGAWRSSTKHEMVIPENVDLT